MNRDLGKLTYVGHCDNRAITLHPGHRIDDRTPISR